MTHSKSDHRTSVGMQPPSYRLPDATRLGRVRLQVANLDRSLSFYSGVLGLRVLDQSESRAVLGAEAGDVPLIELAQHPGARPAHRGGRLGLFHVAILLPDRASLGRFLRHLSDTGIRAGMSDHLVSEAAYLNDPDGLGIEVYADRPREMWRSNGRQIAMTTEPLDVPDLVESSGTEPWSGAPEGTVIGHVHLHVGDLDAASSFYHDALGLDKMAWDYPGALFLAAGGYHHHLGTNTWAGAVSPAGDDDAKLLEWTLVVPNPLDLQAAARSMEAAGYDVFHDATSWKAADPWGTVLRVSTGD